MVQYNNDEKLCRLIAKNLAGEASEAENQELSRFISANPEEQFFYDIIESYWNTNLLLEARFESLPVDHFNQILEKAKSDTQPKVRKINTTINRYFVAAAIIAITASIGIWKLLSDKTTNTPSLQEIVVKNGSRSKTILPDGSIVWINAGTKLAYDKNFTGSVRKVTLEGEAYFDVKKDTDRPFIVHTNDIDIKVLGTAFNVKAYQDDDNFEATLIHGSIEITEPNNPSRAKIIMKPNEKFVYTKSSEGTLTGKAASTTETAKVKTSGALPTQFTIEKVPAKSSEFTLPETAWVQSNLIIENEKLEDLALRLQKWYDVEITIKNPAVAQQRVRAVFKDETIENVMEALQTILKIQYKINGRSIMIE